MKILPFEEIVNRFEKPILREELSLDQFAEVERRDPAGLASTAFTVWQRHVRSNPGIELGAVRDHIRRHGGSYLEGVQALIGQPILRNLAFSRCTVDDPELDERLVAYLLVAHVYPNDLHIADMNFMNPYMPIRPERRRFKSQRYKGLHLLSNVLARAEAYAAQHGCEYVTLTAADDDLVPLFSKFGFVVEDSLATGLAMEKRVKTAVA